MVYYDFKWFKCAILAFSMDVNGAVIQEREREREGCVYQREQISLACLVESQEMTSHTKPKTSKSKLGKRKIIVTQIS